mmetsp:Transcript_6360/g.20369  ORF Transcript_6360/g.20369 Transcript_6360/m.20369 type:complete len:207 (-) Transcript_6360:366-986(-)
MACGPRLAAAPVVPPSGASGPEVRRDRLHSARVGDRHAAVRWRRHQGAPSLRPGPVAERCRRAADPPSHSAAALSDRRIGHALPAAADALPHRPTAAGARSIGPSSMAHLRRAGRRVGGREDPRCRVTRRHNLAPTRPRCAGGTRRPDAGRRAGSLVQRPGGRCGRDRCCVRGVHRREVWGDSLSAPAQLCRVGLHPVCKDRRGPG